MFSSNVDNIPYYVRAASPAGPFTIVGKLNDQHYGTFHSIDRAFAKINRLMEREADRNELKELLDDVRGRLKASHKGRVALGAMGYLDAKSYARTVTTAINCLLDNKLSQEEKNKIASFFVDLHSNDG